MTNATGVNKVSPANIALETPGIGLAAAWASDSRSSLLLASKARRVVEVADDKARFCAAMALADREAFAAQDLPALRVTLDPVSYCGGRLLFSSSG